MTDAKNRETAESIDQDQPDLNADALLTMEFEYIAQSAFQANEDRARVSTYYVVTFGTLVAALFSLRVDNADLDNLHIALVVMFFTLTLFGLSTLLQLVRLRAAWTECAIAMNQIKTYYTDHFQATNLADALRWRMQTIPALFKPNSIAFLMALQVALLGAISLGAAIYFLGLVTGSWAWTPAIFLGLLYLGVQLLAYRYLLES